MRTKVVYTLVSDANDIYLEQAFVSMTSLRYHNKDAHIILVVDESTKESLSIESRKKESLLANEIIVVKTHDSLTNQQKSRYIKTSVRQYLDGDFLFIDTDTIILRSLDPIDNIDVEIGACIDSHTCIARNPYRKMIFDHVAKQGWTIDCEADYFNSGVIYVKDSELARNFYKKWHENWRNGVDLGVNMDQPSFARTNKEMGYVVRRIPDEWNCEIVHGIRFLKDAFILHYLCTNTLYEDDETVFLLRNKKILNDVKQTGLIPKSVYQVFDDPFKGIPALTFLLAGKEIDMMRQLTPSDEVIIGSASFSFLRFLQRKSLLTHIERVMNTMRKIKNFGKR
ncbi:MAG: hypothetical protein K2L07_13220 [Lachnospiraceae bacterium]|nr:hypothetical protein [Lachnospiraceae bacterium]